MSMRLACRTAVVLLLLKAIKSPFVFLVSGEGLAASLPNFGDELVNAVSPLLKT